MFTCIAASAAAAAAEKKRVDDATDRTMQNKISHDREVHMHSFDWNSSCTRVLFPQKAH
jgi:hypothetical protein